MKTPKSLILLGGSFCLAAATLLQPRVADAALLLNFPFNEGSGIFVNDTANGLTGRLGLQDPAIDKVWLAEFSPSGAPGDRSITNSGAGFLVVDDSTDPILAITNGPITLETWVYLDPFSVAKSSEGLVGYGDSYKLGMKGGWQVFTLFGIIDITNSTVGVPVGSWVHLAAAWDPGVGVHFYMDGVETFVEYTNAAAARPPLNNYLGIMSEGLANNTLCAMDRVRIHHALLDASTIDSDPANPRALQPTTLVAYNFNETALPAQNAKAPARPTILSSTFLADTGVPTWISDSPTGLPGDKALLFNPTNPTEKERIYVDYGAAPVVPGTSYTIEAWIKPEREFINERMVIFRTYGPVPRLALSVNSDRTLHTTILGNADYVTPVLIPNDSRWHHVAVTMDNMTTLNFFLDGVLSYTTPANTRAATADSSPPSMVIGMESSTRFYQGALDRLRLHDEVLPVAALDFPAIPGLPIVTTHPTAVVVDAGSQAVFTVAADSAVSYQWYFRTNLAALTGTLLSGETNPTLTLSNVQDESWGYYYAVVSNAVGSVESYAAKLSVRTVPDALTRLWEILPGEREYITPRGASAQTTDLERGMGYNPTTDHLLIGARWTSPLVKGIYILDAATGAEVGSLNSVSNTITGGTIVLTRVAVADDGAIYACNFGTLSDANPLKIYRWANESAEPTMAYQGNPVSGTGLANQQWGKNMSVRGSGMNTQILMDTRNLLAVFTTTDGVNFTPSLFLPSGLPDDWNDGLAWGANGDTFWGTSDGKPLYQWGYTPGATNAPLLRTFSEFPTATFGNFGFSEDHKYMAGLTVQDGPDAVELYNVSDLNRGPVLMDSALFTSDNTQTVGYGNVYIANNRVFALDPNNGLVAFSMNVPTSGPALGIRKGTSGLEIYWPASSAGFVLESADQPNSSSWTTVSHSTVGSENVATVAATGEAQFYRLRK